MRLRTAALTTSAQAVMRLAWHWFHEDRTGEFYKEKPGEAVVMGAEAP